MIGALQSSSFPLGPESAGARHEGDSCLSSSSSEEDRELGERDSFEDALRQREAELREAQRLARVGSWRWVPATDTVTWSEQLYRIAGRDPRLPAVSYREHGTLYSAASWESLQRAVEAALRDGTPYELDLEMIRPDGSRVWVRGCGEVERNAAGRVVALRGTVQDIGERKRIEDSLRASEEKFRRVFHETAVGMVIVSLDGRFLSANPAFCEYLGYSEPELVQRTVESVTHAEDWPNFSSQLQQAIDKGESFRRFEKRCLHRSGRVIHTECGASLIRGLAGEPLYFVGEVLDVTERKRATEAISMVNRRLVETQEQERARIARELHDDINQRLALLAIEIERFKDLVSISPAEVGRRLGTLTNQVDEISRDVQAIARRLHSSKLEFLGLVSAIGAFCRESAEQHKVEIEFQHGDIPRDLSDDVKLCLFRVLQEALHNAVKHSGVRHFEVRLYAAPDELTLQVSDSGIGFDPDSAASQSGLGLTSMRERLHLVSGTLSIQSSRRRGTTILARVPLVAQAKALGASA